MRKGYYMNFNNHSNLEGCHAFLGASQYHWINYDEEKLADSYTRKQAVLRGTVLHDFAAQCIRLRQKLPDIQQTLNMYVNDAVGFKMTPEQSNIRPFHIFVKNLLTQRQIIVYNFQAF